ncbi:YidC/Oxa1 family membrane protein insertase [Mucilaginibacter yixingensis]|uniref:Membrane protein insertase YidC n=1 Tax=Mucilaginibacter yixingensis TaxID=1295612 RepID=A0A2T5JG29_9SPHI|nr:membrane protein insertase YidC [Mucilaginibacter yixingensis]PTR01365.1 YidC/Oxa1 family membrane protein insertase [Mucilaginibacter yixingensis]
MDKNTYTGFFMILVILVGFSFWMNHTNKEELAKQHKQHTIDSLNRIDSLKQAKLAVKVAPGEKPVIDSAVLKSPFGAATMGSEQLVTLENADLRVKLSTRGGKVYSVELKNYKTFDKKPLILFDGSSNHFGLNLNAAGKSINTDKLYFTPSAPSLTVNGKDSSSLTMRLSYSPTQYIDYIYSLKGEGNKLELSIKPTGLDDVVASTNSVNLQWTATLRKQEKDMKLERQYSTVYFKNSDNDVDYLSVGKDDNKTINDKKLQWFSFKQHFFSNVLISKAGMSNANLSVAINPNDTANVKSMTASVTLNKDNSGAVPMEFYFGPNRFKTLQAQGYDLEKQVDLGWGPLKYINRFATLPVFNVLSSFNWNYGLIILALTVILKLVLSPLTYKSYLSMAKMRVLKPEMDEIKAKVGEDNPTLLQQEYMKLYKKAGVNPLGGCLPMLLQMPIVIAFFRFFPSLFELRGQSFLWMHDLSTYDSVIKFGTSLPFLGDHISLMCLLMTISTLIYTYFNNQISGATGQMKYIGYVTPIIFLGALNGYPAGLNYYYFLANMFTFLQQFLIRQMVDDKKIHAQIQENKKKPEDATKKKKSGFQARMEEMMRQQQQAQQAKGKK